MQWLSPRGGKDIVGPAWPYVEIVDENKEYLPCCADRRSMRLSGGDIQQRTCRKMKLLRTSRNLLHPKPAATLPCHNMQLKAVVFPESRSWILVVKGRWHCEDDRDGSQQRHYDLLLRPSKLLVYELEIRA